MWNDDTTRSRVDSAQALKKGESRRRNAVSSEVDHSLVVGRNRHPLLE
jgi:hypothetical protein